MRLVDELRADKTIDTGHRELVRRVPASDLERSAADHIEKLEAKIVSLQYALQDAIDAPKGVVPDSASQFYDYQIGAVLPDEPMPPSRKRKIHRVE